MGKVVYSMMVSLDGFVERPNHELDWVLIDEELHTFENDQARHMSAFLYGRRMYETMAAFWPTADQDPSAPPYIVDFARIWKEKPKIVFSTTLDRVDWNSRLIRDDVYAEVKKLKDQPGSDLGVGGADIAATFIRLGLIDEYQLLVHPVVLGSGTPFFPPLEQQIDLRLLETRTFRSGVVYLRYERSNRPASA